MVKFIRKKWSKLLDNQYIVLKLNTVEEIVVIHGYRGGNALQNFV